MNDFVRKCDQIHRKLRIWSHLLKKSILNFMQCSAMLFDIETIQLIFNVNQLTVFPTGDHP